MIKGKIIDINADGSAIIQAPIDPYILTHRKVKECYVDFIDSRPLSDKQRRMCYALTNAIADWAGYTREMMHLDRKFEFTKERAEEFPELTEKLFSLSTASMTVIRAYQKVLIEFILDNDIPLKFPLLDYVDDIANYTYMCLIHKKCCICGRRADLHHIDAIGMGNDRTEAHNVGREVISLCREHHTEIHTIGKAAFMERYHLEGGVTADNTICKIYGLKK